MKPLRSRQRLVLGAVVLLVALSTPATQSAPSPGPKALTVLPPGNGSTITLDAYLKNQASGDCADLGPHECDQLELYRDWGFKNAGLSPDASHVAGAVSSEEPIAAV